MKLTPKDMALAALFAAVIAVCSWISIPTVVPFTLQTFGVFAAVLLLGGKRGTLAVTAEGDLLLWYGEEAPVCVLEEADTARRWGSFVYAIKRDGSLWQLEGFGEEDRRILTDPQPTKRMEGVREVSGPLALKEDGSVWSLTGEPAKVFDGAASIQSDGCAFTALDPDGGLWCWGTLHQPGNVQKTYTLDEPALCCEGVAQAACCYDCILILKTDGSLLTLRYEDGALQLFPVA